MQINDLLILFENYLDINLSHKSNPLEIKLDSISPFFCKKQKNRISTWPVNKSIRTCSCQKKHYISSITGNYKEENNKFICSFSRKNAKKIYDRFKDIITYKHYNPYIDWHTNVKKYILRECNTQTNNIYKNNINSINSIPHERPSDNSNDKPNLKKQKLSNSMLKLYKFDIESNNSKINIIQTNYTDINRGQDFTTNSITNNSILILDDNTIDISFELNKVILFNNNNNTESIGSINDNIIISTVDSLLNYKKDKNSNNYILKEKLEINNIHLQHIKRFITIGNLIYVCTNSSIWQLLHRNGTLETKCKCFISDYSGIYDFAIARNNYFILDVFSEEIIEYDIYRRKLNTYNSLSSPCFTLLQDNNNTIWIIIIEQNITENNIIFINSNNPEYKLKLNYDFNNEKIIKLHCIGNKLFCITTTDSMYNSIQESELLPIEHFNSYIEFENREFSSLFSEISTFYQESFPPFFAEKISSSNSSLTNSLIRLIYLSLSIPLSINNINIIYSLLLNIKVILANENVHNNYQNTFNNICGILSHFHKYNNRIYWDTFCILNDDYNIHTTPIIGSIVKWNSSKYSFNFSNFNKDDSIGIIINPRMEDNISSATIGIWGRLIVAITKPSILISKEKAFVVIDKNNTNGIGEIVYESMIKNNNDYLIVGICQFNIDNTGPLILTNDILSDIENTNNDINYTIIDLHPLSSKVTDIFLSMNGFKIEDTNKNTINDIGNNEQWNDYNTFVDKIFHILNTEPQYNKLNSIYVNRKETNTKNTLTITLNNEDLIIYKFDEIDNTISKDTIDNLFLLDKIIGKHPNILWLVDYIIVPKTTYMIYHNIKQSLRTLMNENIQFSTHFKKVIILQLLFGLSHLHNNNIVHSNITPTNILLSNGIIKLSDLSSAKKSPCTKDSIKLQSYYQAPEILLEMDQYTTSIDMWTIGCIFIELFLSQPLFKGNDNDNQLITIFEYTGTPKKNEWKESNNKIENMLLPSMDKVPISEISPNIGNLEEDLIQKCLTLNPNNRITAKKAIQHPYFNDIRKTIKIFCENNY